MRAPFTQLYVHLVWSTWDRFPLLNMERITRVYAMVLQKSKELNCLPIAIGGMDDHVHLLVRLHPAVSVAEFVKEVKGTSSHLVNHEFPLREKFRWQGAYGAFTHRKDEVEQVTEYIHNQQKHHLEKTLISLL